MLTIVRSRAGNISLTAALVLPCAFVVIAGGVDYISVSQQKVLLQSLADRAALASAQELIVANSSQSRVSAVAARYVAANYDGAQTTSARVIDGRKAVEVSITAEPRAFMNSAFSGSDAVVTADSVADVSGGGNICLIGLNPAASRTISMGNGARITAGTCVVYSNSTRPESLFMKGRASLTAEFACIAGGLTKMDPVYFPRATPVTDCPGIADPLNNRPNPTFDTGRCDYNQLTVEANQTLSPGVYCGGLKVSTATATLLPGTYIIKDGLLTVESGGQLTGDYVGFFLTGPQNPAGINFTADSTISLLAPKTGDMAGLLFFEDRNNRHSITHTVASNNARKFEGTIYLPKYRLLISGGNTVADRSDFTIIIASSLELAYGPNIVLNTNYSDSDVPVPDGVGNQSPRGTIRLTR